MKFIVLVAAAVLGFAGQAAAQSSKTATFTELVAPIAFYPDVLVAQVLAASTHPDEIGNAGAWLDGEHSWDARQLAQEVDGNHWHPDIKALALTRPVLETMRRNVQWAKALGEAYASNPSGVVAAVQAVRHKAQAAGELVSSSGQRVVVAGAMIHLEPVDAQYVYVPGAGVFDVAAYERFGWGWHAWQINWTKGDVRYQDAPLASD
ncbi:MAG: DUF3300 domain-containing protein [Betaproteobacteria bacterium]|nr:DUF3300 domain-containing protein [Betaproteobacteria bacterium]MBV9361439.1 DUF3300 domain-containing protein [Betaproteobacteria bacterium]